MVKVKDRIKQGTNTTGSGTITLNVSYSASGFRDFSVLPDNTVTYYVIEEGFNWEVGIGTYSGSTLTRDTIFASNNSDNPISLAGSGTAYQTLPADKSVLMDTLNVANVTGIAVGATGVKFNDGTIQTTAASPYGFWKASDGSTTSNIASNAQINFTGLGNVTVTTTSGSPNTISISGADQDLSSFATTTYVNTVSGNLQTQITSNTSNISTVSGLTVTNANNISSNDSDIITVSGLTVTNANNISSNDDDIVTVSGLTVTNANNISANDSDIITVSGLTVTNANNISSNDSDIVTVSGLTVTNANNISSNDSDIVTVSGLTVTNANNISSNDADIVTVSGLTVTNANNISSNDADITTVSGLTVTNSNNISSNSTNITTVSGLVEDLADAPYITYSTSADLDTERVLSVNSGLSSSSAGSSFTIGHAATGAPSSNNAGQNFVQDILLDNFGHVTGISVGEATGGGGGGGSGAPTDAQYVTLALDGDLSNERVLTAGTGIKLTDAGANGNITVDASGYTVTAGSGLSNGGSASLGGSVGVDISPLGVTNDMLAGSIANGKLSNSSVSYGGINVSLGGSDDTPQFNLVDATGYLSSSLVGTISNAQLANNSVTITAGTGLGNGGSVTLGSSISVDITGIDGTMINDGSITNSDLANSSITITAGTGLSNGGSVSLGGSVTVDADSSSTSQVGVVQLQDSAQDGVVDKAITPNAVFDMSGVLQSNIDGKDNYQNWVLRGDGATTTNIDTTETVQFTGAGSVSVTLGGTDNRTVTVSGTEGGAGAPTSAQYLTLATDGTLTAERVLTAGSGMKFVDGGANNPLTIHGSGVTVTAGDGLGGGGSVSLGGSTTLSVNVDDSTIETNADTLRVKDGGITNAKLANTSVTYTAGTGLGNGGAAALGGSSVSIDITGIDTTMIVDGTIANSDLANSSITVNTTSPLNGGSAIALGGNTTLTIDDGTTSQKGAVQLQDSAQDGITDKAITPNAVFDMSGVIGNRINDTGNTLKAASYIAYQSDSNLSSERVLSVNSGLASSNAGNDFIIGHAITGAPSSNNAGTTFVQDILVDSFGHITGIGTAEAGGGGAPTSAQYLTLATDGDLTAERVLTAGSGVKFIDGGANNPLTVHVSGITVTAGDGLGGGGAIDLGGSATLSVNVDDSTIEIDSDTLRVKDGGITAAKLNANVTLDAVTDNGSVTTNNITVGMIDTSGVRTPLPSGSGGSSRDFNLSTASTFAHTLAAGANTTLTVSNVTDGQKFMIRLKQNPANTGTVTWWGGISWAGGGTVPTLTAESGKADSFGFLTTKSGEYDGYIIGQDI